MAAFRRATREHRHRADLDGIACTGCEQGLAAACLANKNWRTRALVAARAKKIPEVLAFFENFPVLQRCHFLAGLCQKQDLYMGVHVLEKNNKKNQILNATWYIARRNSEKTAGSKAGGKTGYCEKISRCHTGRD